MVKDPNRRERGYHSDSFNDRVDEPTSPKIKVQDSALDERRNVEVSPAVRDSHEIELLKEANKVLRDKLLK